MVKTPQWTDDNWLPLLQLYLRKPVGIKPVYSRDMVTLAMELHVTPQSLQRRMKHIDQLTRPRLARLRELYEQRPERLKRAVRLWRGMRGYGHADAFYEGVAVQESWEKDFRPLSEDARLTPVALILVLDLYFQLTPQTMVAKTPEVVDLARRLKIGAGDVVEILELYQLNDAYLNRSDISLSRLLQPCSDVWSRFEGLPLEQFHAYAEELADYYK